MIPVNPLTIRILLAGGLILAGVGISIFKATKKKPDMPDKDRGVKTEVHNHYHNAPAKEVKPKEEKPEVEENTSEKKEEK